MSEVRDAVARAICEVWMNGLKDGHTPNADRAEEFLPEADAAIAAFLEAIKEQGWQVVPREPTDEMCASGNSLLIQQSRWISSQAIVSNVAGDCCRAMLAAAPEWKR